MNILLTRKIMLAHIKKLDAEVLDLQYRLHQAYEQIQELQDNAANFEIIHARMSAHCDAQERWLRDLYEEITGKPYKNQYLNDPTVSYMRERIRRSYKVD